eukprot:TRINITY_DN17357_c0_g1_i2.p1 TRINITY_DN17357_c0_g1~~TRINITY_DN17357_c0_g1_i2.p1  ORF type:complete len:148 (-),score=18.73 TRINITY_DN17357_c0_g1_i2:113-556(-)
MQQKQSLIAELTTQVDKLGNGTARGIPKLRVTTFSSNKLISRLKNVEGNEYRDLKSDYRIELKSSIKERLKLHSEIKNMRKLLKLSMFDKPKKSVPELKMQVDTLTRKDDVMRAKKMPRHRSMKKFGRNNSYYDRVATKNTWSTLIS